MALAVRTDLVAGEEFDSAEVVVASLGNESLGERLAVDVEASSVGAAVELAVLDPLPPGDYLVELYLRSRARGSYVAKRPAIVTLDAHRALTIPVSRSCRNVRCPPTDNPNSEEDESEFIACLAGSCVSPRCTEESPEFCLPKPQCVPDDSGQSTDCQAAGSCALSECALGVCWARPRVDDELACDADTQWCHPSAGCTPSGAVPGETLAERCRDGLRNGDESDVDCGGSCTPCDGVLSSALNDHCRNGVQDQDETQVDCGGACTPCPNDFDCSSQSDVPVHECLALSAFADATYFDGLSPSRQWKRNTDICSWFGVTCTNGGITHLNLLDDGLRGTLPPELGNLKALEEILANYNDFTGTLPPELGELPNLRSLRLEGTGVSGSLPAALAKAQQLHTLDLSYNALSGTIPEAFASLANLEVLNLTGNALEGTLPPLLGTSENLRELLLSGNALSGTIPNTLETHPGLEILELNANKLEGEIPSGLGGPRTRTISLGGNALAGPVPEELETLPALESLWLGPNVCLWAKQCTTFPTWLESMDPDWSSRGAAAGPCTPPENTCR